MTARATHGRWYNLLFNGDYDAYLNDLTIYGVSFATEATFSTICGLGGAYAVFNEERLAVVEGAI